MRPCWLVRNINARTPASLFRELHSKTPPVVPPFAPTTLRPKNEIGEERWARGTSPKRMQATRPSHSAFPRRDGHAPSSYFRGPAVAGWIGALLRGGR